MPYIDAFVKRQMREELEAKRAKSQQEPEEKIPSLQEALWMAKAEAAEMIEDGPEMPEETLKIVSAWLNARMQQLAGFPISGDEEAILAACPPPTKEERD